MKKRAAVIGVCLSVTLLLAGCSWTDVRAKFTGEDIGTTNSGSKDYVASECVTVPNYKGIEVDVKVSEEDIQAEIDSTLNNYAKEKKVKKGTCKQGDRVNIDFVGKMDGKEFDGGSAEDQSITLGQFGLIPGFDDGIIGMKVGEKKDLNLTFPDDYGKEELNGKPAVFTVTLNYISETDMPELDEEFVTKNTEFKTVDEYKESIRKELLENNKKSAGQSAYAKVEEAAEVKTYPQSVVDTCTSQLDAYYRYSATQYGFSDFNTFLSQMQMNEDTYKQSLEQAAKSIAKTQLLTEAIAAIEGITVSDDEVKEEISNMVTQSGQEESELRKSFEDLYGDAITIEEYYHITLLSNKVIDFVGENAVIKE